MGLGVSPSVGEGRASLAYVAAFLAHQGQGRPDVQAIEICPHPGTFETATPGTFESAVALIECSNRHPQLLAILLLFYEFF